MILLMTWTLHYLKDPQLWELWHVPYYGPYTTPHNAPATTFEERCKGNQI